MCKRDYIQVMTMLYAWFMMMTEQPGKFTKISMNCIIWNGELDDM